MAPRQRAARAATKKARRPLPAKRRAPARRAVRAVDPTALIEAATQVVADKGFSGASLAALAKAAGVSVASLRGLESRESLLTQVVHRHLDEMSAVMAMGFVSAETLPLQNAVEALVGATVQAYRRAPKLHLSLVHEAPRLGGLEPVRAMEALTIDALREWLLSRPDVEVRDPELAAFLVYRTIDAVVLAALADRPRALGDPSFVAEVALLLTRYLQRDRVNDGADGLV